MWNAAVCVTEMGGLIFFEILAQYGIHWVQYDWFMYFSDLPCLLYFIFGDRKIQYTFLCNSCMRALGIAKYAKVPLKSQMQSLSSLFLQASSSVLPAVDKDHIRCMCVVYFKDC